MNDHDLGRVSRRTALGGALAAGAALGGAKLASAETGDAGDPGPVTDPSLSPPGPASSNALAEIAPAPATPGIRYVSIAGIDLKPGSDGATYSSSDGEISSGSGSFFTAPVHLPNGAVITEYVTYAERPDADSTLSRLICHRSSLGNGAAFVTVADQTTGSLPISPTVQAMVTAVAPATDGAIVDNAAAAYFVIVNLPADANHDLWGVRIGYRLADAGSFFPIDPVRVYDSRTPLPNQGMLAPNQSRQIYVGDARANGTGAVTVTDAVPPGVTAIACNLTVTGTTGPNFLALTPGDATSFTTSAINWSSADQSVANGLIVKVDGTRLVTVWCGDQSGSTHVILDVNGYYR
jgi:hypothetical protein